MFLFFWRNIVVYKRVLLKISGEALAGESGSGIDFATVEHIVKQVV